MMTEDDEPLGATANHTKLLHLRLNAIPKSRGATFKFMEQSIGNNLLVNQM